MCERSIKTIGFIINKEPRKMNCAVLCFNCLHRVWHVSVWRFSCSLILNEAFQNELPESANSNPGVDLLVAFGSLASVFSLLVTRL